MRSLNLFAALAASYVTGFAADAYAASRFDPESPSRGECGSGYHADAGGSCQPDVAEVNRYCPAGRVYHPAPNGWTCDEAETAALPEPGIEPEFRPRYQPRRYHIERARERPPVTRHVAPRAHVAHHGARRAVVAEEPADPPRTATAPVAPVQPRRTSVPPVHISSGGGGGGGGGGGWSDRRLKRDIVRLGASPSGLPIYSFQYVWGGPRYVGVMAQDLLKLRPDAVIFDESGYYRVDYAKIDVEMREEVLAA